MRQVKCIGKIEPLSMPLHRLSDREWIRQADVWQSEHPDKSLADLFGSEIAGVAENPFGFQNYGVRDEQGFPPEKAAGLSKLVTV